MFWLNFTQRSPCLNRHASWISSKKRVHTKRTTLHFFVRNGERFPLLLETNNAFRIVTHTYFYSEHTIDISVVKVLMVLLEINNEFFKLTKRSWVRNGCIPNEQRWIFFVGNEQRFSLLLGTNNTLRIFMVLSETKSALVIKISQRYCLLTVWNSYLLVFVSSGDLTFFFGRHS